MINLNLTGKRALICGASKGIGKACAIQLAELGCEVIVLARQENALKELVATLPVRHAQTHSYFALDLADFELLEKLIKLDIQKNGEIEILVNNAGGPSAGPIVDATDEQFENAFKLHLRANALLAKQVIPGMKAKQYGRIINIISTSVKSPIDNLGVSNTIRWAVASWAKTLSYEVAKYGITVNSVLPGSIETSRLESLMQHQADKRSTDLETVRREVISQIPAGRIGSPEEVAQVVGFLASPAASYVNGVAMPVDGGRTKVI